VKTGFSADQDISYIFLTEEARRKVVMSSCENKSCRTSCHFFLLPHRRFKSSSYCVNSDASGTRGERSRKHKFVN
jgi:hypothetical protein